MNVWPAKVVVTPLVATVIAGPLMEESSSMGVPLTAAQEVMGERRNALLSRQGLTCNERGYARAQRRLDRREHRRFCRVCVRTWGSYAFGLVSALT